MTESTTTELADAGDLEQLRAAAHGLSPSGVWMALNTIGIQAQSLEDVPRDKVWSARQTLVAAPRVSITDAPAPDDRFFGRGS